MDLPNNYHSKQLKSNLCVSGPRSKVISVDAIYLHMEGTLTYSTIFSSVEAGQRAAWDLYLKTI